MEQATLELDALSPQNLQVMEAYSVRTAAAKAAAEEFDGWLERIDSLPGLTPEMLTRLHGQLIALGFLKFEISGRCIGLRYQIGPRGRQALEKAQSAGDGTTGDISDDQSRAEAA